MLIATQSELKQITGSLEPSVQCSVLRQIGIMPLIRKDGKVIVFKQALIAAQLRTAPTDQPEWSALDDTKAKRSA